MEQETKETTTLERIVDGIRHNIGKIVVVGALAFAVRSCYRFDQSIRARIDAERAKAEVSVVQTDGGDLQGKEGHSGAGVYWHRIETPDGGVEYLTRSEMFDKARRMYAADGAEPTNKCFGKHVMIYHQDYNKDGIDDLEIRSGMGDEIYYGVKRADGKAEYKSSTELLNDARAAWVKEHQVPSTPQALPEPAVEH